MPRTPINNSFTKGMKKDKALTKTDPEEYFEASNLRISTDETGQSVGSLATIKGTEFEIAIPNVGNVVFITAEQVLEDSLGSGASQSFDLIINGTSATFTHAQTEVDQFYKALATFINATAYPGQIRAQWKEIGVAIYSLNYSTITSASAINWTLGVNSFLTFDLNYVAATTGLEIIGQINLRDTLVLFTTDSLNVSNTGQIWKIIWNDQNVPEITLVRHGADNFKKGFDIEAVARYESPTIQRVCFTDHNNPLRTLNIYSESSFIDELNITPAVTFDVPYVIELSQLNGNLYSGWYIYAYRLKNIGGGESTFSRFSQPFPINQASEENDPYWEYQGCLGGLVTSKALTLQIDVLDKSFSHIDIVVGYMKDLLSTPTYSYVFENKNLSGADSFKFTHSEFDQTLFISEAEILIPPIRFSKCKTLSIQDNRLIVGNVSDDLVDITSFDANTFRYKYNNGGGITTDSIDEPYTNSVDKRNPYNSDANNANIGDYKQLIRYQKSFPYKQGGQGANIKYEFITKTIRLDSYTGYGRTSTTDNDQPLGKSARVNLSNTDPGAKITSAVLNGKTIPLGGYWNNFKNPFIASHYRGYMRSEIYRFGIVFFDSSGRTLDTKWIDDIRMPEAYDFPIFKQDGGNGTDTINSGFVNGFSLGVKFKVKVPSNIKKITTGFSIVRAERTPKDETIVGQGMLFDFGIRNFFDTDGTYGDKFSTLKQFMYRTDRLSDFGKPLSTNGGRATFTAGIHNMVCPEFLLTSKYTLNPNGFSIRPICAVQPKASRGLSQTWIEMTSTEAHLLWVKLYGDAYYYGHHTAANNPAKLSTKILDSLTLSGLTTQNTGPKVHTELLFTVPKTSNGVWGQSVNTMNGFINLGGYFDADTSNNNNKINNSSWLGNNQIQFKGRGGTAHVVQTDSFRMLEIYCSTYNGTFDVDIYPKQFSRIFNTAGYKDNGVNGITVVDGFSPESSSPNTRRHLLFNLYKENANQYGGFAKNNIESTEYISTGHFQIVSANDGVSEYECEVFGGDTYVNIYDEVHTQPHFTTGAWETSPGSKESIFPFQPNSNDQARGVGILFAIESTLNLDWRTGQHMAINGTGDYDALNFVNETDVPDNLDNPVPEWTKRENDAVKTYTLSEFTTYTNDWDNRAWASEEKINGEPSDSWTVFKPNNFFDVDGNLGPINKLEKFNNDMLFFQDRGFGKLIINPNPVLNTADDIEVSLGTGKVLHDSTYYSVNVGTKHQWSVVSSSGGVYWFDIINKKPYFFNSNGMKEYSDVKGLHSFFTNDIDTALLNADSPSLRKGIRTTYDYINNEILFTFLGAKTSYSNSLTDYSLYNPILNGTMADGSMVTLTNQAGAVITYDVIKSFQYGTSGSLIPTAFQTTEYLKVRPTYRQRDFTISHSEVAQSWNAFYDFQPSIYLNTGNRLLSPNPLAPERLYLHNVGKYNTFYDVYYPSILELVTAPAPDITKVFDNVSWHTIAKSSVGAGGRNLDQITFSKYFCYNDYQHSGIITLDPTSPTTQVKKIEREWQMAIPRNVVTSVGNDIDVLNPLNWDFTQVFKDRIRDKYLIQHFEYNNNTTDQFIIDRISTYLRKSSR